MKTDSGTGKWKARGRLTISAEATEMEEIALGHEKLRIDSR